MQKESRQRGGESQGFVLRLVDPGSVHGTCEKQRAMDLIFTRLMPGPAGCSGRPVPQKIRGL